MAALAPYPPANPAKFADEPVYCSDVLCACCCPCVWVGKNADLRAGGDGQSCCNGACFCNCLLHLCGIGACVRRARGAACTHESALSLSL